MDKLILIAESDPRELRAIRNCLLGGGYPVMIAGTASAVVRSARDCRPDLILMDFRKSGPAALRAARVLKKAAATKRIPIVALRSGAGWRDPVASDPGIVQGRATVPVRPAALLGTIRGLLSGREAESASRPGPDGSAGRPSRTTSPPA